MIAISSNHRKKAHIFKFRNLQGSGINIYGMEAQNTALEDDFQAYVSIQVERYLKRKTQQRFCSEAEKDVILQIIADSWIDFCSDRNLSQMDTEQKIRSFYGFTLVFPYFVAEEESLISFDFRKKRSLEVNDECSCGSHIPYRHCCGGIKNLKDLLNGSF